MKVCSPSTKYASPSLSVGVIRNPSSTATTTFVTARPATGSVPASGPLACRVRRRGLRHAAVCGEGPWLREERIGERRPLLQGRGASSPATCTAPSPSSPPWPPQAPSRAWQIEPLTLSLGCDQTLSAPTSRPPCPVPRQKRPSVPFVPVPSRSNLFGRTAAAKTRPGTCARRGAPPRAVASGISPDSRACEANGPECRARRTVRGGGPLGPVGSAECSPPSPP